jgi:hypothetical protein
MGEKIHSVAWPSKLFNFQLLRADLLPAALSKAEGLKHWNVFNPALDTHFGHPFWTPILDTHFGHPFWTPILDTHFGHPFWTPILNTHFGGSC